MRMEAGFRKYVHREVDHKRLAEKEKKKKKKETPGQPFFGILGILGSRRSIEQGHSHFFGLEASL